MERQGFIYILICLVTGKGYVGQTIKPRVEMRWAEHVKAALRGNKKPLYAAMRQHGFGKFVGYVLATCKESKLNALEMHFVKKCDTFIDGGHGYNLTTGGGCFRLSKQSIYKIRRSLIKYYTNHPERRDLIGAQSSVRMSDASVRNRLSESARNQFDDKARKKMSRLKRRQYKKDPSIRLKVSAAATAQFTSKEARVEKSKVSKRGWAVRKAQGTDKASAKARRNMTTAQFTRFENPTERAKLSAGQLRRYQNETAHVKSSEAQYKRFAEKPMSAETNAKIAKKTRWNWTHNSEFRATMLACRQRRCGKKST